MASRYERRIHDDCPGQVDLGMRLLERLPPARWTLEWYLPWWLGEAFGLSPDVSREIVLSNVLGLGSIRLQDDLADGELAPADIADAGVLAATLYAAALEPYRTWFGTASPFWRYLDRRMRDWQAAGARDRHDEPVVGPRHSLAARGAPLHLAAFAVCLLTGRMTTHPALETCLDDALEALVLYDHLADWEADLDAGRWNAFVAACSAGSQVPDDRARHRAATYVTMLTEDAVATWFGRIDAALQRSMASAGMLSPPIPPLTDHLRRFASRLRGQGVEIQARYRDLGDQTARLLLKRPVDARSLASQGRASL